MSIPLATLATVLLGSTALTGGREGRSAAIMRMLLAGGGASAAVASVPGLHASMPTTTLGWLVLAGASFAISSLIRDAIKAVIWLVIAVAGGVAAYIWLTTGTEGLQTQIDNLFS